MASIGSDILRELITNNDEFVPSITLGELRTRINEAVSKYGCNASLYLDLTAKPISEFIMTPINEARTEE